jgi:tetratricopeptide (TPR) repeat protein
MAMKRLFRVCMLLAAFTRVAMAQTSSTIQTSALKIGIAQFDAEKLEQAKATLTPLAQAGDADAMLYLGRIAIEQSDGDEAVDWLELAIKKNDHSSLYYQWLGTAYSVKGSAANPLSRVSLVSSMKQAMERSIALDSSNVESRVNLLQFYLQAPAMMGGGVDKAREQAAAIMARNPYQGRLANASIAENQKDSATVERTLRELGTAFPDSSAPAVQFAIYYYNAKRYDDSFRVLDDRLRRSPNDGAALYQLGRVGAVSGTKRDRAQWALNRFLLLPHKRGTPSLAAAHWRIGMIHEANGDGTAARSSYETALRLDPKLAGAKASLDKLK